MTISMTSDAGRRWINDERRVQLTCAYFCVFGGNVCSSIVLVKQSFKLCFSESEGWHEAPAKGTRLYSLCELV